MKHGIGWCVVVCALAPSLHALADARDATPVTGIRLSERGRLHLAISANMGLDSNPNYVPWELTTARTTTDRARIGSSPEVPIPQYLPHPNKVLFGFPPDVFVAVRPSMTLVIPGDRFSANANASLNYFEYLGVLNPGLPFLPGTALEKSVSPLDYNSGYRRLRTLDGQIGGGLDVNRSGPFGFSLNGNLVRAVDPGPIVVGSRLARTALATGASGSLRPGGGTMSFTGGMGLTAEIYDPQNGRDPFTNQPLPAFLEFSQFPRNLLGPGNPADVAGLTPYANATVDPRRFHNAGVGLTGQWQWRFLPKSAVFVEGSLGSHFYLWPWDNPNAPTFPIGVTGGFLGQLTAKLGLVASIGLSYPVVLCLDPEALSRGLAAAPTSACARNTGLLNGQPADGSAGQSDLDTITGLPISQYTWFAPELTRWQALAAAPVGQLEARYQFTPTFTGAIGVRRQVRLVPLYRYLSDNRIYASLVGVLWNRVQLNAQISEAIQPHGQLTDRGVGYNAYPFDAQVRRAVPLLANSDPGRWDNDLALNAGVDIFATRWLLFGVSNQFTWHATNARTGGPNDPPGIYNELPFNLSYVRNVTMLKAELRY